MTPGFKLEGIRAKHRSPDERSEIRDRYSSSRIVAPDFTLLDPGYAHRGGGARSGLGLQKPNDGQGSRNVTRKIGNGNATVRPYGMHLSCWASVAERSAD